MRKTIFNFCLVTIVLFVGFGCNWVQDRALEQVGINSNANFEEAARDGMGLKKTGIAECDEVVEILVKKGKGDTNQAEESWASRAATEVVKQQIYNQFQNGNTNQSPQQKEDLRKNCRLALDYLKDGSTGANSNSAANGNSTRK